MIKVFEQQDETCSPHNEFNVVAEVQIYSEKSQERQEEERGRGETQTPRRPTPPGLHPGRRLLIQGTSVIGTVTVDLWVGFRAKKFEFSNLRKFVRQISTQEK